MQQWGKCCILQLMTFSYAKGAKELSQAAKEPAHALVLGIPTLQTGVFGGIIMGAFSRMVLQQIL